MGLGLGAWGLGQNHECYSEQQTRGLAQLRINSRCHRLGVIDADSEAL